MNDRIFARSELILGGQKSGKSRRAELLAQGWLAQSQQHRAVLIATAQPWDDEMRERIARHQQDRAVRVPGMTTVEEPLQLAQAITQHSSAQTLVVVDCLTLWLTNLLMPANPHPSPLPEGEGTEADTFPERVGAEAGFLPRGEGAFHSLSPWERAGVRGASEENQADVPEFSVQSSMLLDAIRDAPGSLLLVGNEIGLGVIPLGRETRAFVDALGRLNQDVARVCERVTLMAAGLPLTLKGPP